MSVYLVLLSLIIACSEICSDDSPQMVYTKPLYVENENLIYYEILEPPTLRYIYSARPARNFGINFNQSYYSIELVGGEPADGCSPLTNQHVIRGNSVILLRGQCSFMTKSIHAQEAGAAFVFISDDDAGSTSSRVDMVHDDTGRKVNIPALFIPGKDGDVIRQEINVVGSYALLNIPVNLTAVPYHKRNHPPWTLI